MAATPSRTPELDPRLVAFHPATIALAAILVAAGIGLTLAGVAGATPSDTISALVEGMVGTPYAIGKSLNGAAVLMLVGAGFSLAYRAGLVNVGGEGQLCLGGIAATAVGTHLPAGLPSILGIGLTLLSAALAGGAWAAIAGLLRVWRGTSEIITTLLLNFVALALVSLMVQESWLLRQPMTSSETLPQSRPLTASAHLPLLGLERSPATAAVLVALVAVAVVAVITRHTAVGLRLTALGLAPGSAARLGVRVGPTLVWSLVTAGAFAGVAGGLLVATAPFVLAAGFSSGFGFAGLVVGLLARGSMTALTSVALLFAFLVSGGINLQLVAGVPATTVSIVQSLIILLIAASSGWAALRRNAARGTARTVEPDPETDPESELIGAAR
jgi:general nucleoside transport system permease protein